MEWGKMNKWKLGIVITLVLFLLMLFVSGYRFTALSAATSHTFVLNDSLLIGEWETGSTGLFLFKNDEQEVYRTVVSEKSGLLYISRASTFEPYRDDAVQTIGGISYRNSKDGLSLLVIMSNDGEVAYIEAGDKRKRERQDINKGELISFLFPYSIQIDHLNAKAFNKDGEELYYFGLPKNSNRINLNEDLRWHKIEDYKTLK